MVIFMNIKDVAQKAGVSISTVSRVINGTAFVSEELKKKVLQTIVDLGYNPDYLARGLRLKKTFSVGMIVPDVANPFFAVTARGAEEELRKAGISLIIINTDQDIKVEIDAIRTMISKRVDGVIFMGSGQETEAVETICKNKIPVVFLDRIDEKRFSSVVIDNYAGMFKMMEYLYSTNHRNFIYLGGPEHVKSSQERKRAVLNFASKHSDIAVKCYPGEYSYKWALEKIPSILGSGKMPDAVVCGNDLMAFGVIDALKKKGVKIPEDVSVTGFDDVFYAAHYSPPLTTVHQPNYELGREGARLLLDCIENGREKLVSKILPVSLVVRDSTKIR